MGNQSASSNYKLQRWWKIDEIIVSANAALANVKLRLKSLSFDRKAVIGVYRRSPEKNFKYVFDAQNAI